MEKEISRRGIWQKARNVGLAAIVAGSAALFSAGCQPAYVSRINACKTLSDRQKEGCIWIYDLINKASEDEKERHLKEFDEDPERYAPYIKEYMKKYPWLDEKNHKDKLFMKSMYSLDQMF